MRDINFYNCTVKFYPYRTARVFGARIELDRRSAECDILEGRLAAEAGVSRDNHTVYEIKPNDGSPSLYIWCTDFKMYIGTSLKEENW